MVFGQRLTQGSPDIFLGWGEVEGRQFYVRQLADMKGGYAIDNIETLPLLPPLRLGIGAGARQGRRRGDNCGLLRQERRP